MNRRFLIKSGGFTAIGLALAMPALAGDDGKPGKLEAEEFKKINADAGAKLKALKADDSELSETDKALAGEIALGGMMQLKASEIAAAHTKSPDVKLIAEAEIEEQKGLAAKLKEFAAAKGFELPAEMDEKGKKMIAELEKGGEDSDREYLKRSGVDGHEELLKTMNKVKSNAADSFLKALAENAIPLIEVHLAVSKDEVASLG